MKLTLAYAGMIMRAAYASGRIGRDPTVGLKGPKARGGVRDGVVAPDEVPTRAEASAIVAATPLRFRAGVALGFAGLRIGEVRGMTADRIALDRRAVTVDRQMQRIGNEFVLTTPKVEKVRTITVPGLVAVELRRHLRERPAGLIFEGLRGAPMLRRDQFYSSAWRPALRVAGLDERRFRFDACRHWRALTLLAEGRAAGRRRRAPGRHGRDGEPHLRPLRDDREVPAAVPDPVLFPVSLARHGGEAAGQRCIR